MPSENPFAAPRVETLRAVPVHAEGAWRDGDLLVMSKGYILPDFCVKCGEPAAGYRVKRTLYWHAPGWYLLLVVGVIFYIIAAVVVQQKATVRVGLCPRHRAQRRNGILAAWLMALGGAGLFVTGMAVPRLWQSVAAVLVGIALVFVSIIVAILVVQTVHPKRIDRQYVWLKRVGPEFLVELPSLATAAEPPAAMLPD